MKPRPLINVSLSGLADNVITSMSFDPANIISVTGRDYVIVAVGSVDIRLFGLYVTGWCYIFSGSTLYYLTILVCPIFTERTYSLYLS